MRKVWNVRSPIDGILAAAVATLAISIASPASAQSGPTRTPAELAIDAAVPVPEPANVTPPSPADFAAQAKALANGETKPAEIKTTDVKPEAPKPVETTATTPAGDEPKQATANPAEGAKPDAAQDVARQIGRAHV